MQKLLYRFSQNLVNRRHMCQGRSSQILVVISIWIRVQTFLKEFHHCSIGDVKAPRYGFDSVIKFSFEEEEEEEFIFSHKNQI